MKSYSDTEFSVNTWQKMEKQKHKLVIQGTYELESQAWSHTSDMTTHDVNEMHEIAIPQVFFKATHGSTNTIRKDFQHTT